MNMSSTENLPAVKSTAGTVRRPRVLLVVESSGAGTGRHVADLAEGLADRGCDVHVVYGTARADARFYERLDQMPGVNRQPIAMHTVMHPSDVGVVLKVRRYMKRHGPFDVVHGHSSKGGAIARLAAPGTGTRAFYTLHGLVMTDPTMARPKRWVYGAIERLLSVWTSRLIAVAPEEARAAVGAGLGKSRVVTVPNGIGPMRLTARDAARKTMNASADDVVIGFVGRLVAQKGIEVLVRSFAAVAPALPNARLVIVGDGPLAVDMKALAASCGVADRVSWLGERDARQVWAGFDVFAIASWKEGLPYVVIEAMATGLPVVATTSAGVEILVEEGVNGHVVPPGDVTAFARSLTAIAGDRQRLAAFGAASLRIAERFTAERMVEGTLAVYRDAGVNVPADDASPAIVENVPAATSSSRASTVA